MQVNTGAVAASSEGYYAALSEIGQLLVRAVEPPALYEAIIEVIERRLGARLVMIGEADHAAGWFRRVAPVAVPSDLQDIYPELTPLSLVQPSFWRGVPQLEPDLRRVPGLERLRDAYKRHDVTAAMAIPVTVSDEVRAGLVIRAADPGFFTTSLVELLQQAAASIGLGLEAQAQRHRLLKSVAEEARQRRALRLLSEMIKVVTHSADEEMLLTHSSDVACRVGGYRFAWIGLCENDGSGLLQLRAHAGLDGVLSPDTHLALTDPRLAGSAVAAALAVGQPCVTHWVPGMPRDWPLQDSSVDVSAILAQPLRVDGALVGALVIGASQDDAFTPVETQVFQEMAVELGLGLQIQRTHAARLLAERDLRSNLQQVRAILSNQHSGVLVTSEDGFVKFTNEAFCALFGLAATPAELEGQPAATVHARISRAYLDPEREIARISDIAARGEPIRGEEVRLVGGRILLRDFMPIMIDGAAQGRIWQQHDVTERRLHEARVERLAFYDVVTGLPNRRLLFELLEQARTRATEQGVLLAVGVLDLDRFKSVNDTVGHSGGDRVLAEASSRIQGMLREADVLARFGGDEFALLIPGLDSREQLDVISRCILQALRAPFNLMDEQLYVSASIGWTLFPIDGADSEGLIRHADMAMYEAKEEGKDRGSLYEPAMELEQVRLQAMRERIAQALQQSHLQLLFQPIVYIDGLPGLNGVAGMEALLRLNDRDQELIAPDSFMHVLDDPQLARPIGRYVLDEALRCCQTWLHAGMSIPVSVNISTRHLLHPAFFADIDAVLDNYPDVMNLGFGIEVTETGPSMDHARAKLVIEECRRRGIRVGLDDFGTGSASLSHIQQLDIEHIKLDQSFVHDILSDERNMAIAAGVITTARMLAKVVIAEGVETSAQGDLLASLGCHQLQGYSISRPLAAAAVPAWVAGWVPPASWNSLVDERQSLLSGQSGVG
ncbi:bifunctional diguanylate cyclase/phosphodiesterase [Rhodanobacter sp. B05]|uniref:sensor domain-containing phosphodiesterase n=1 Tax=Rhodanobacter sp. B05 TaxID=1945859 RepID=UPI000986B6BE|nr:EAL domain-containing protein [Rhodanobacter sp. B05]OOG55818.1 bifunctional diguanylate cyclase/phosphodiesterase [Rhodanobacter sp. B05]